MIREIYIRDENDPLFEPGIIDYSDEIESIVSQIRVILGTKNGEILGDYDFGLDLEYLVFETRVNSETIEEKVNDAITQYVRHSDDTYITSSVSFGQSKSGYDYCIIDIHVNGRKVIGYLIDKE